MKYTRYLPGFRGRVQPDLVARAAGVVLFQFCPGTGVELLPVVVLPAGRVDDMQVNVVIRAPAYDDQDELLAQLLLAGLQFLLPSVDSGSRKRLGLNPSMRPGAALPGMN